MTQMASRGASNAAQMGALALSEGRYAPALAHFIQARKQDPDNVEVQKGAGICLHQLGRYPEAGALYREALRSCPHDPELWANLGLVESALGHHDAACRYLEIAVQLGPELADVHYNHGNACLSADRREAARDAYLRAIRIAPDHYEALISLGLLDKEVGRAQRAEAYYRQAIAAAPERPEAYANLAALLDEEGAARAAEQVLREGLSRSRPKDALYYNLGNVLKTKGVYSEALDAYRRVIEIRPDHARAHWNKALTHLASGQYGDGWREYEWRQKKQDWPEYYPRQLSTPVWRGEGIGDKVLLVHDEQGYGDTIQFCRYLAMARKYCQKLVFETRRPLLPLFEDMSHIDLLVERSSSGDRSIHWDLHVPLLSLPYLLGTEVDSIPSVTPYLSPDPLRIAPFQAALDRRRLNIGLVWAGNPEHRNDRHRSMSLKQLLPLLTFPQVDWHSLQLGSAAKEAAMLPAGVSIRQWEENLQSFADTAALIWSLDLVICVDTAVAHLTGALGKPVWLLLPPRQVDWRWQLKKDTTAWYPSMTLFRRSHDEDGPHLGERLKASLEVFAEQASSN
jgi:tetratricopeptide (TPR) repeat protein